MDYPAMHSSLTAIEVIFPGGLCAFSQQDGLLAFAGDELLLYHPSLPREVAAKLNDAAKHASIAFRIVNTRNFDDSESGRKAQEAFLKRLAKILGEYGLEDVRVSMDPCTLAIAFGGSCFARPIERLEGFLRTQAGLNRYHLVSGNGTVCRWERPVVPAFEVKLEPDRRAITDDDVTDLRIMLETLGGDVDAFVRRI